MGLCPCGSKKNYSECCEPFLKGTKNPPTAESLMRSRYTAFHNGDLEYIAKTHHESTRKDLDMDGIKTWALESKWNGLEIVETSKGSDKDSEGKVEFKCMFNYNGQDQIHHELSTFEKTDGKWYFVDGVLRNNTFRRTAPKVGRNDPCPCGSGKKYKKCCGA